MCVTIEKDGLRSVPDGKSPVESGLCHVEWAVPGYCDGMIEKAQETVAPFGVRGQNTHRTRVSGSYRRCFS